MPDPASLGQHMHDAAAELARRGHRVSVCTARAGYADPSRRYPRREVRDGVEIRRLPLASLGKRSMKWRLLGGLLFVIQATLCALVTRNLAGVLVSTSPPMAPVVALVLRVVRRVPFVFWVMDVNPDQAIAMGQAKSDGLGARTLDALNRAALRRAAHVVTLDRFMRDRLAAKADLDQRLSVLPPWPHEDHLQPVARAENPFRVAHGLKDKLVVMYSGNISPAHPLTTLIEAAARIEDEAPDLAIVFVGGGLARATLEALVAERGVGNVRFLPYQPLERLGETLAAADAHVVAVGEAMVGIVHPSKLYGAMAVARPVLLLGPAASHAGEIVEAHDIGWRIDHDRTDQAVDVLRRLITLARDEPDALAAMGRRAREAVDARFSKSALCSAFCDVVERHLIGR